MFKLSLTSPELRLKVIKSLNSIDSIRKPPPPIYPRFPEDKENVSMVECEQKRKYNFTIFQKFWKVLINGFRRIKEYFMHNFVDH